MQTSVILTLATWFLLIHPAMILRKVAVYRKPRGEGAQWPKQESIHTTTLVGKLIFHIFGAVAKFEREVIRERTNAGLQAARARGQVGGRPSVQSRDPKKVALATQLYNDPDHRTPVQEICATLHISKSTLYRYLQHEKGEVAAAPRR
jgi:DNA invertase Pin-like site-specific DNA recombinase